MSTKLSTKSWDDLAECGATGGRVIRPPLCPGPWGALAENAAAPLQPTDLDKKGCEESHPRTGNSQGCAHRLPILEKFYRAVSTAALYFHRVASA